MQTTGEDILTIGPNHPLIFKKHRFVPKQVSVLDDVTENRPELLPFFAAHPLQEGFKTSQDVLLEFIVDVKRAYAQRGMTVAFRYPKGRGKVRLVKVGPRGGEKMIGAGDTEQGAFLDAAAKEGATNG